MPLMPDPRLGSPRIPMTRYRRVLRRLFCTGQAWASRRRTSWVQPAAPKFNAQPLQVLCALWLLVFASACHWETSASEDIRSSGLYLDVQIMEESDDVVRMSLNLFVGGRWGNRVILTGEDRWEVNGAPAESGDVFSSADRSYEISLVRSDERLTTTVTLSKRLDITELEPADSVGWNEVLTVYWIPSESTELIQVSVEGSCITAQSTLYTADPGMHTTPHLLGHEDLAPCPLEVEVVRTQLFPVHEAFDNGQVTVHGVATTELDYVGR